MFFRQKEGRKIPTPSVESLSPFANAPTVTNFMLNKGRQDPGYWLRETHWQDIEAAVPGAIAAGKFVEGYRKARTYQADGVSTFSLANAIYYTLTNRENGLLRDLDETYGGQARALLVALIGGQLWESALRNGVVEQINMKETLDMQPPSHFDTLFHSAYEFTIEPYSGGRPSQYRWLAAAFLKEQKKLITEDDKVKTAQVIAQKLRRGDSRDRDHAIGSEELLRIYITKLQKAKDTLKEGQSGPFLTLLPADRRIVAA